MADFATLYLQLKNQQFNRGVEKSSNKLGGLSKGGLIAGASIAAAGTAAVMFAKKALSAFGKQEDAIARLNASLGVLPGSYSKTSSELQKYAAEIQKVTKYGDEAVIEQMAFGKNLGINENQLKDATKAAIGLAAKFKLDLKTSMMLVGRASQGQTQMLTRYGIVLGEGLSDQEKFNKLLKIGAGNFGLAEAEAKTLNGVIEQAKNAWGDLLEVVGELIKDIFDVKGNFESFRDLLNATTKKIKDNKAEIILYSKTIVNEFKSAFKSAWNVFSWFWDNTTAVIDAAYINIANIGKFFVDTWESGFKTVIKMALAGMNDLLNIAPKFGKDFMKAIFTGKGVTGAFAEAMSKVGENIAKVAKEAGIALPDIASPQLKGMDEMLKKAKEIEAERKKNHKKILSDYEKAKKKAEEEGNTRKKNADIIAKTINESIIGRQSFTEAAFAGTTEAQKREMGSVSHEKKTEENTKKTAENTKELNKTMQTAVKVMSAPPTFLMA